MDLETSLSWGFIVVMFFSILYLAHKVDKIYKMLDILQKAINKLLDFQGDTIDMVHSFEHRIGVLEKEFLVNYANFKDYKNHLEFLEKQISEVEQKLFHVKTTIDESLKKLESRNDKDYFDTMI